jgi:hypothetical protein
MVVNHEQTSLFLLIFSFATCVRDAGSDLFAERALGISCSTNLSNGVLRVPATPDSCEIGEPNSRSVATIYYRRDLIFLTAVVGLRFRDKPCLDGPMECGYGARELFVLVN